MVLRVPLTTEHKPRNYQTFSGERDGRPSNGRALAVVMYSRQTSRPYIQVIESDMKNASDGKSVYM